jgi:hypothetical protein
VNAPDLYLLNLLYNNLVQHLQFPNSITCSVLVWALYTSALSQTDQHPDVAASCSTAGGGRTTTAAKQAFLVRHNIAGLFLFSELGKTGQLAPAPLATQQQ